MENIRSVTHLDELPIRNVAFNHLLVIKHQMYQVTSRMFYSYIRSPGSIQKIVKNPTIGSPHNKIQITNHI